MPGCSINDSINVNTGQNNEMSAMGIIFYTISKFFNLSFQCIGLLIFSPFT